MGGKKAQIQYLRCILICHGKSEKEFMETIKQNLRLKIHIESDKKGSKSIQINSLNKTLKNHKYGKRDNFLRYFEDIELIKGKITSEFKIFTLLDTDDKEKEINLIKYLNKEKIGRAHV